MHRDSEIQISLQIRLGRLRTRRRATQQRRCSRQLQRRVERDLLGRFVCRVCWCSSSRVDGSCRVWGSFNAQRSVDVSPPVDARLGRGRPNEVIRGNHFHNTLVFLQCCNASALLNIGRSSRVGLGHHTRPVAGIKDRQVGVVRVERPNAVVVHRESVHASSRGQRPNLDRLIRRSRHDRIPSLVDQDIPNIIGVTHELGYQLPGPGIPYTNDILGSARGQHRGDGTQGVDGALLGHVISAGIYTQDFTATIQIPQIEFMIKTSRRNPTSLAAGTRQGLDVVGMLADALGDLGRFRVWAPESHGGVGRGRDQGGVILGQDDVVDPMTMGLDLGFEAGRARFAIGRRERIRRGERSKGTVKVPRANDTVATCGIPWGDTLEAVQPTWRVEQEVTTARLIGLHLVVFLPRLTGWSSVGQRPSH